MKGRRRTFDTDSRPNAAEQERLGRRQDPASDTPEGGGEREQWVDEGPVRREAAKAVGRASRRDREPAKTPKRRTDNAAKRAESALEVDRKRLVKRLGAARAERTIARLGESSAAYAEDRYEDARKTLKPLVSTVPDEPAIRELYGLSLYRLGRWAEAIAELEEFGRQTGSTEQHPVLADCNRALGRHKQVEKLWSEIGEESLAAPIVAEGRIVYAGSLADRGKLREAIAVLEGGSLGGKSLQDHHLRMRYVLGDLYDRAGDRQGAKRYFATVAAVDPKFYDVSDRLRQL